MQRTARSALLLCAPVKIIALLTVGVVAWAAAAPAPSAPGLFSHAGELRGGACTVIHGVQSLTGTCSTSVVSVTGGTGCACSETIFIGCGYTSGCSSTFIGAGFSSIGAENTGTSLGGLPTGCPPCCTAPKVGLTAGTCSTSGTPSPCGAVPNG